MPKAGRPRRTPGKAVPPVIGGKTSGTMRTRGDADAGVKPKGTNLDAPKPRKKNPGGNRVAPRKTARGSK